MSPNEKDLIRYRLERAWETLEQAQVMSDTGHPAGAINRLYYACFYAVNALLLCHNMASAKHSGVLSLFNKHFIKTGVFPADLGRFYSDLFDSRQDADYADMVEVEDAQLKELLPHAKTFIGAIENYVLSTLEK